MGLITRTIDDDDFVGVVHTLTCEATDRKLANILITKPNSELEKDVFVKVKAISPFAPGSNSGEHVIGGLLAYGPIGEEESRHPTVITNVEYDVDNNGNESAVLMVAEAKVKA
jgi:hypothetical protein